MKPKIMTIKRRLECLISMQALLDSSNNLLVLFMSISNTSIKDPKTVPDPSMSSSSSGTVSLCQGSGGGGPTPAGLIIIRVLFSEQSPSHSSQMIPRQYPLLSGLVKYSPFRFDSKQLKNVRNNKFFLIFLIFYLQNHQPPP